MLTWIDNFLVGKKTNILGYSAIATSVVGMILEWFSPEAAGVAGIIGLFALTMRAAIAKVEVLVKK